MNHHTVPASKLSVVAYSIGLALMLALAACGSGADEDAASRAPTASSTTDTATSGGPGPNGPSPSDWLADLATDGTSLYVTVHGCPGRVASGHCTIQGAFAPRMKAYPVTPWRYANGTWEELTQPGAFSSYTDMMALPGGLMFVPQDPATGSAATGPLRVSLDDGRTWEDWPIPEERRRCRYSFIGPGSGPCTVGVAGDYVVIASNYGWVRRSVDSDDWEDITPPERTTPDGDAGGYGLLTLDDGTLIATANDTRPGPDGSYRVSRDAGSTWSDSHDNPGEISEVNTVNGSSLFAECHKIDFASGNSTAYSGCGWYRSTNLETWTQVKESDGPGPGWGNQTLACTRAAGPGWRSTGSAVRVGDVVYAITHVPYVGGHEATRKELPHLDLRHRVRHVLEVSADNCLTWQPVLTGTRP